MDTIRIPVDLTSNKNITFKLEQDFENLEILSLKVSAYDVYAQTSSDFGVVVGRVNVNGGFGVQNAKVSIFIPITTEDEFRPEILKLYPFKSVNDTLPNGVRYNIFPRVKQPTASHQPIGIFPDISDLTYYPTYLEIYEKYYKYTTTTNNAGDYMIFGVPLGIQYAHMDFDLFDTKSFYLTADDLVTEIKTAADISTQLSDELTQVLNPDFYLTTGGTYEVVLKTDLNSMPNVFSENKMINVVSFWGSSETQEIGITRCDFSINYQYTPTVIFFGSYINMYYYAPPIEINATDNAYYLDKNWSTLSQQSSAQDLKVIAYKHLGDYNIERYAVFSAVPSSGSSGNGVFIINLPMYENYYITDEFGQLTPIDGTDRGIPTKGHYVFELFDDNEGDKGNGRRAEHGDDNTYYGKKVNYWTNISPAIRVPASRNGHPYISGWDVNDRNKSLFEYDILKGIPRFYTVETKFRKHNPEDIRYEKIELVNNEWKDQGVLYYLPTLSPNSDYNYPIKQDNLPEGDVILRGSLYSPRFRIHEKRLENGIKYAKELSWIPWKPVGDTGNYDVKAYDWVYGIGVRDLLGINKGGMFTELYPDSTEPVIYTWFFGDNPENTNEPPGVNLYAQLLSQKPEAKNRNLNGVHYCFNLAVDNQYTAGLFISSNDFGINKILFETSIVDITDILSDLVKDSVYSSYKPNTDNKYKGYYYLFGKYAQDENALYKLKERYFG